MSLKLSYPERTNLYLTNLNNKSKIEIFIPDGVLKCEDHEDFYINVIQFNTFHSFYNVIQDYNNNFNITIDNDTVINCSIPSGNITAYTIREVDVVHGGGGHRCRNQAQELLKTNQKVFSFQPNSTFR